MLDVGVHLGLLEVGVHVLEVVEVGGGTEGVDLGKGFGVVVEVEGLRRSFHKEVRNIIKKVVWMFRTLYTQIQLPSCSLYHLLYSQTHYYHSEQQHYS